MKKLILRSVVAVLAAGAGWGAYAAVEQYTEVVQIVERQNRMFDCCGISVIALKGTNFESFSEIDPTTPTEALSTRDKWKLVGDGERFSFYKSWQAVDVSGLAPLTSENAKFTEMFRHFDDEMLKVHASLGVSAQELDQLRTAFTAAFENDEGVRLTAAQVRQVDRIRQALKRKHELTLDVTSRFDELLKATEPSLTLKNFQEPPFFGRASDRIVGSTLVCLLRPDSLPQYPILNFAAGCRRAPTPLHFALAH